MARLLILLSLCLFAVLSSAARVKTLTRGSSLTSPTQEEELLIKIQQEQQKVDVPIVPLKSFGRKKGLYASGVKLNFHGTLQQAEIRRLLSIFDNNMFVTAWVTSQLIESAQYQDAPMPSEEQLQLALKAIGDFYDHNENHTTSVMTFWPQVYNQTTKYYQSTPQNLLACIQAADELPVKELEEILELLGLKELAKEIDELLKNKDMFTTAFKIPPDFDDTFVNLGLGSLLYQHRAQFPAAYALWESQNKNLTSVFDALKKYPYRPFSSNKDENSIDTRTYLWIRPFLDQAKKDGKDVALVPTWVQDLAEVRRVYKKGVHMPFRINNVDATVAANTIYGITASILSGLVQPEVLDDPVIEQVYHNTSALIAHALMNNMTNRPDLALTYYPSRIEFYWFVARSFAALDQARVEKPLPRPVMESVYQMLKTNLEVGMTQYIVKHAKPGVAGSVYYDDFLGDGDLTHDNRSLVRGEDRIFTTAMAANALLYTWTTYNQTHRTSHWRTGVPEYVRETIGKALAWLNANVLSMDYDAWNAFFSGSVKGYLSLPYWYPGNRLEYLNGTVIHNRTAIPKGNDYLWALEGYVDPADYDVLLKQKHFGLNTPTVFNGYNTETGYFPFWSSEPYTYSSALVAFTRYRSLRG